MKNTLTVTVGPKDIFVYANATLTKLVRSPNVVVEGLGHQCSRVLEIAKIVEGWGKATIRDVESFEFGGAQGVRVHLSRVEGSF